MNLQIAITSKCNLRCTHCHSSCEPSQTECLDESFIYRIVAENSLLNDYMSDSFHLMLTGGEPFLHPEIARIIDSVCNNHTIQRVSIFTNGLLIDQNTVLSLKQYKNIEIQISLDGLQKTHDQIRGLGTYENAISVIVLLASNGIPVTVAMTVGKWNLMEVQGLVFTAKQNGANAFLVNRFISSGRGQASINAMLSPADNLLLYETLLACKRYQDHDFELILDNCSICSICSLIPQPQIQSKILSGCNIGTSCIHIDPDYNMITCPKARLPIGDLRSNSLVETFFNSPLLAKFRERNFGTHCGQCHLKNLCGGCRAIAYHYSNDIFGDEVTCPFFVRKGAS